MTPDSFSDGGLFADSATAIAHGLLMIEQGADIIDVGGESTRPGAKPVSVMTETARVVPVIEALAPRVRVSVDTRHGEVARAAVKAGATIINDVSASLALVAADTEVAWIAMHMQGQPVDMQTAPVYDDVVSEVFSYLLKRAADAQRHGVSEVWVDPGIGFGKSTDHNLALLAHLARLSAGPFPVAVGTSRKRFLGELTGRADRNGPTDPDDRLEASLASAIWCASQGAAMLRVHDVSDTMTALERLYYRKSTL